MQPQSPPQQSPHLSPESPPTRRKRQIGDLDPVDHALTNKRQRVHQKHRRSKARSGSRIKTSPQNTVPQDHRSAEPQSHPANELLLPEVTPLTEAALAQLNSSSSALEMDQRSGSSSTVNGYDPGFENELRRRGVSFLTDSDTEMPDGFEEYEEALARKRETPEPEEATLIQIRGRLRKASNKGGIMQSILPKIVPIERIWDSGSLATVPNHLWNKQLCLPGFDGVALSTPKPDQTFGLQSTYFPYPHALASLRPYASPVSETPLLCFPAFTVEAKGDKGNLKVSRLQNLHNAAVMGYSLLMVHKKLGCESTFFKKIYATTLSLTNESMELSYCWAVQGAREVWYYSRVYDSWPLNNRDVGLFQRGCRCIRNALEWSITTTGQRLEPRLREANQMLTPIPTPPSSSKSPRKRKKVDNSAGVSQEHESASQNLPSEQDSQGV